MLLYQLLTGTFPFWDSVQNLSLQQASSQALLPVLCSPVLAQHLTVKRQTLADGRQPTLSRLCQLLTCVDPCLESIQRSAYGGSG